ncbi:MULTISPECIES: alpha/beta hydrolase [unclassified Staphylococcus]|uniref:alpha/beta hydrolase fold domain-containing protein n=1 Tax=unclassified Staphylococcus TaxID=91994 RepID=UPI0021D0D8F3|nr:MULTISPECIES: alpha/beta hydrolase [unclassified Staphylococcus]UXR69360.1 alpha/beta hydrolase [Staphylococcus sp. IVB6246]UXR71415.1 alpha/beta hydrolase [Staphylococcus sp. IVB6240]UXR76012.1 alpha/beta hydrolase [Staphylococcus sp. IVB6233]UXR80209.1 alpha/beta hydrolase [Staphylococcus sp. IVB6218]
MKRNIMSKLMGRYLSHQRHMKFKTEPEIQAFLDKRRVLNEEKHKQPDQINVKSNLVKDTFDEMQVFRFNFGHHIKNKILYIYGGTFVLQPSAFHWRFMDKLAYETLHEVVMPIYPKAPANTYRETHAAIEEAYRRLLKETEPENIVIMGDASGGNMGLSFVQSLLKQDELPLPGKLYLISPWLDLSLSNPDITEQVQKQDPIQNIFTLQEVAKVWADDLERKDPRISPMYGSVRGLPPVYMFGGTSEIFYPDMCRLSNYFDAEQQPLHFYEYKDMVTAFPLYPIVESHKVLKQIRKTIDQ